MFYISLYIAHIVNFVINKFNLGSGYTWPGHIILRIFPQILKSKKIKYKKGLIVVSGTNGKTTTTKLITHLLRESGFSVSHNTTGANLKNGVVSAILLDTDLLGRNNYDYGVFEVDEFALPELVNDLDLTHLVLLNLSRDQLDRYGEVDIILEKWLESINGIGPGSNLILDSESTRLDLVAKKFKGHVFYFDSSHKLLELTRLYGEFNAKNVNAAATVVSNLGLNENQLHDALETFEVAYGRGEVLDYKGTNIQIFLAKNPASFNQNLKLISSDYAHEIQDNNILVILNDKIPDGRDVSWIYDVSAELLVESLQGKNIYISGTRALDMAVRLNYAGINISKQKISANLEFTLEKMIEREDIENILVFPNYSSMLELRKLITGKSIL